jgi:hypothetical protein
MVNGDENLTPNQNKILPRKTIKSYHFWWAFG